MVNLKVLTEPFFFLRKLDGEFEIPYGTFLFSRKRDGEFEIPYGTFLFLIKIDGKKL